MSRTPYNNDGEVKFKTSVTFNPQGQFFPIICKAISRTNASFKPIKELPFVKAVIECDESESHEFNLRNAFDIGVISLVSMRMGAFDFVPSVPTTSNIDHKYDFRN